MELFSIILTVAFVALLLWGAYLTFTPVAVFWRRLTGYKIVEVTTSEGWSDEGEKRILVTKDGVNAHDPQFANCWNYVLKPDGNAHYDTLTFDHATWKYI